MENKRAFVDLKTIAIPKANNPLLIYKGCLTIPYKHFVTNFALLFKAGDTPICLWANILITKLIPKRVIPTIKATGIGIAIFGPLVNGKAIIGTIKVKKAKTLIRNLGILFLILLNPPGKENITTVITYPIR